MVARTDRSEYDFEDAASAHGRLNPWSDDQTTAMYQPGHLYDLQEHMQAPPQRVIRHKPVMRASAPSALPAGWVSRNPTLPMQFPAPRSSARTARVTARVAPSRTATRIGLQPPAASRPQPSFAAVERGPDLENPFARSSANTFAWLQAVGAIVGLFGAVLFGRVVLDAGKGAPASRPIVNAPQSPPAAAPVDVRSIPGTPAEPLPPVAASAEPLPQPAAVEAEASRGPRSKHVVRAAPRRAENASSAVPDPAPRSSSAAPERRERSTAAPATLRINSRPWSQVFIDGRAVGNTPQLGISLEPGTHSVRLVNPEFSMIKTFKLTLHAGENVTRVETLEE
jgi:hypothetical protein